MVDTLSFYLWYKNSRNKRGKKGASIHKYKCTDTQVLGVVIVSSNLFMLFIMPFCFAAHVLSSELALRKLLSLCSHFIKVGKAGNWYMWSFLLEDLVIYASMGFLTLG